jgi:flagellar secretion chaperone FliS
MNPYAKYARPEPTTGWTRIDLLLALYDGALERLDKAAAALRAGDPGTAVPLMARVQLIVTELAAGVRTDVDEDMGTNYLRLYEFVVTSLRTPALDGIADARKVLATLRDGFEAIRQEANELERSGKLAAADKLQMVLTPAVRLRTDRPAHLGGHPVEHPAAEQLHPFQLRRRLVQPAGRVRPQPADPEQVADQRLPRVAVLCPLVEQAPPLRRGQLVGRDGEGEESPFGRFRGGQRPPHVRV